MKAERKAELLATKLVESLAAMRAREKAEKTVDEKVGTMAGD